MPPPPALLLLSSLARGRSRLLSPSSSAAANAALHLLWSPGTGLTSGLKREEHEGGDASSRRGFASSFSPMPPTLTPRARALSTSTSTMLASTRARAFSTSTSTSTPPPTMLASTRALSIDGLDDDQAALFDAATDWSCREMAPFSSQWDQEKTFPLATVRRAAEMGFCSLTTPAEFGGSALSRHDASLVFEGLSYGDVTVAAYLTIHSMVSGVVSGHGSAEQRARWLPRLASAEALSAYALTEPSSGSDAAAMRTTARPVRDPGDGSEWYEISGEKSFISCGGVADLYLVMAKVVEGGGEGGSPPPSSPPSSSSSSKGKGKGEGGSKTASITAFLVEKGTKGLTFGPPERKMGWNAQPTTSVSLDRVRVRARDSLVGVESGKSSGGGFKVAMQALDGGRVNIGAISVGGASRAVDLAREYCRQRTAFGGTPLAAFQATQFALADALTDLCAARGLVRAAAKAADAGRPVATFRAAAAKRFASDAASRAADAALQRLGGYGFLQDYAVERLVRDLRVHQIVEGTNEIQRVVMWRELERMDTGVSA